MKNKMESLFIKNRGEGAFSSLDSVDSKRFYSLQSLFVTVQEGVKLAKSRLLTHFSN